MNNYITTHDLIIGVAIGVIIENTAMYLLMIFIDYLIDEF